MSAVGAPPKLAFALDFPTIEAARSTAERVAPAVDVLKVGLELFLQEGKAAVTFAQRLERDVFLDLKLHDIPETVERAVDVAAGLGVRYLTLHASGGSRMLERAANAVARSGVPLELLAVTVLTSLDAADLARLGMAHADPKEHALRLAEIAQRAGVRGAVTSVAEAPALRAAFAQPLFLVTPGIRPGGVEAGDQKRTATPEEAARAGVDLVVVGRPIRDAAAPEAAAAAIRKALHTTPSFQGAVT